jgi:hypothetical protein
LQDLPAPSSGQPGQHPSNLRLSFLIGAWFHRSLHLSATNASAVFGLYFPVKIF